MNNRQWARRMQFRIAHEVPYEGTPGLKDLWPGLFAAAFIFVLHSEFVDMGR